MLGQQRHVRDAFPERRDLQRQDIQPVIQVRPKPPGFDLRSKGLVGRRNDTHVDLDRRATPHPLDLALLQDPKELCLHLSGHVSHLVQEECASAGPLELPTTLRGGPGECPGLVAKQLTFDQPFRNCGAIELLEWPASPRRRGVYGRRNQLFAGPALPEDQDRSIGIAGELDLFSELRHGLALSEQ